MSSFTVTLYVLVTLTFRQLTISTMEAAQPENPKTFLSKTYDLASSFASCVIGRFVLTFLLLHTIHWTGMYAYTTYCIDTSVMGYFTNMINGHGPICHAIMTVAYQSQTNIYSLLGTAGLALGVSWVTDRVLQKPLEERA